ncbi:MAG: hypothetical protein F6K26_16525 [Moorea sp. SIO2I5]|nr:hypothetical protein [Moorena sp. SIO2I5]
MGSWGDGEIGRWGVSSAFPLASCLLPLVCMPIPDSRFPIPDSPKINRPQNHYTDA